MLVQNTAFSYSCLCFWIHVEDEFHAGWSEGPPPKGPFDFYWEVTNTNGAYPCPCQQQEKCSVEEMLVASHPYNLLKKINFLFILRRIWYITIFKYFDHLKKTWVNLCLNLMAFSTRQVILTFIICFFET